MCDAIVHQEPDDWGTFVEGGVGLGMRRLSIIDLAGGHQPIGNEDGTVLVVLNSEICNHVIPAGGGPGTTSHPLRHEVWCTARTRGADLQQLQGMFALSGPPGAGAAAGRDHFGQKPLFHTEEGPADLRLEIKALWPTILNSPAPRPRWTST
jgi:asparagine synthase (glutamine-hydrolysing)